MLSAHHGWRQCSGRSAGHVPAPARIGYPSHCRCHPVYKSCQLAHPYMTMMRAAAGHDDCLPLILVLEQLITAASDQTHASEMDPYPARIWTYQASPGHSLLIHAATSYATPHDNGRGGHKLADLVHRVDIVPADAWLPKAFCGEDSVGEEACAAQLHPHLHEQTTHAACKIGGQSLPQLDLSPACQQKNQMKERIDRRFKK